MRVRAQEQHTPASSRTGHQTAGDLTELTTEPANNIFTAHNAQTVAYMSVASEEDMATLAADSPSTSPPFHRRRKSWARRVERICCQTIQYFPLTFVYGLTTWAVWVEAQISFVDHGPLVAYLSAFFGIAFYLLANISYTIAVFTHPGSPLDKRGNKHTRTGEYEGLPTHEDEDDTISATQMSNVTAKSTGKQRYCKKCKTLKPDRTHHCSTCKQCVLKMDHHCPWLATCVGLHNYKPFILFLSYVCLFCYVCFALSFTWVWGNITETIAIEDGWRLVHTIMLSVLSGIIGLVLSGFTGWHLWLAATGATTIESLEKTRYLSPIRKSMDRQFQQERNYMGQEQSTVGRLREMHANALPGVLREEEGEVQTPALPRPSARDSLQRSYASLENQREHDRYESYLDERDSEKLPNAFDLGWRRNLLHLFGENPLLWAFPVCNTTGDGWQWEVSDKWIAARDHVAQQRAQRQRQNTRWEQHNPQTYQPDLRWTPGVGFAPPPRPTQSTSMPLQPLDRRKDDDADSYNTSSDEESRPARQDTVTADWNDIPADFLVAGSTRAQGTRSRNHNKHD